MSRVKTYWDEIKNQPTHYYGGKMGWEIHYQEEQVYDFKKRGYVTKLSFKWPYFEGTPREERSRCRKEVMFKHFRRRILAQASANKTEYQDLMSRVGDLSEEEFRKTIGEMRGFELRNYICQKHWTYAESFASFWRG